MERIPVVLYGATGYTGRLVAAALARRGTKFALAGRDRAKLAEVAKAAGGAPETIAASLDDAGALRKLAERARVILDCAGPFARMGPPVVEAAIAGGAHYLDITGEPEFMRWTCARGAEAEAKGVALVNAVGFDVVPSDAAAALAAAGVGSPVTLVRIAIGHRHGRPSQGTVRSMLESLGQGGLAWTDGGLKSEPVGAERWTVPFPQPVGTRECLSVPIGDVVTAPRTTGAESVRGFMSVSPLLARWAGFVPAMGKAAMLPGVRAITERWLRTLPEGPDATQRAESRFAVLAEATGPKGVRSTWVTGGDGYDFTAESASLCATLAAAEGFAKKGALSPAQAFGAKELLDALAPAGVHWGEGAAPTS